MGETSLLLGPNLRWGLISSILTSDVQGRSALAGWQGLLGSQHRLWYKNFYRGCAGFQGVYHLARLRERLDGVADEICVTNLLVALGHDFLESSGCGCLRLRLLHGLRSCLRAFIRVALRISEVLRSRILSSLRILIHHHRQSALDKTVRFQWRQSFLSLWRQYFSLRIILRVWFCKHRTQVLHRQLLRRLIHGMRFESLESWGLLSEWADCTVGVVLAKSVALQYALYRA